jgi:hypothetical protein
VSSGGSESEGETSFVNIYEPGSYHKVRVLVRENLPVNMRYLLTK